MNRLSLYVISAFSAAILSLSQGCALNINSQATRTALLGGDAEVSAFNWKSARAVVKSVDSAASVPQGEVTDSPTGGGSLKVDSAQLAKLATLVGSGPQPVGAAPAQSTRSMSSTSSAPGVKMPPAPAPRAGPMVEQRTIIVHEGDTLTSIAADHCTTVAALMQANNLTDDVIVIGQPLVLP